MTIRGRASRAGRANSLVPASLEFSQGSHGTIAAPMEEYELEHVKREIVESRALSIKTNNLVNALAADLKSISKRQQGAERKVVLNSATAYVVTIALLLVFVKLAWDIRLETVRGENKETRDQLDTLAKDVKVGQEREELAKRASHQAGEFYQLIVQN